MSEMPFFTEKTDSARIAIIVPVYNVEKYIRECLDSILQQTHENFVAFLVNDGSTDKSGIICDEYAVCDNRFKVIHKSNGGVSSARNAALDEIERDGNFDFISFIDSDDFVSNNFLEKLVTAAINENADYSLCNTITFRDGESPHLKKFFVPCHRLDKIGILEQYLGLNRWRKYKSKKKSLFNKLLAAKALHSIRFDTRMRTGEDVNYFAQIARNLVSGIMVDYPLYFYRVREGSLMTSPVASDENTSSRRENMNEPDTDLGLDTIKLFMEQAPDNSDLYWKIHGQLIDTFWKRMKKAYISNNTESVEICKKQLLGEMHPLRHLSIRHYRMLFLIALGNRALQKYFTRGKK